MGMRLVQYYIVVHLTAAVFLQISWFVICSICYAILLQYSITAVLCCQFHILFVTLLHFSRFGQNLSITNRLIIRKMQSVLKKVVAQDSWGFMCDVTRDRDSLPLASFPDHIFHAHWKNGSLGMRLVFLQSRLFLVSQVKHISSSVCESSGTRLG